MNKIEIITMIIKREKLYQINPNDPYVDDMASMIIGEIKIHRDTLEIDFILESLTQLGLAPNLVYDDNGKFAISRMGYSPIVMGDDLIEGDIISFVEREQWKPTIREAVYHYLNEM